MTGTHHVGAVVLHYRNWPDVRTVIDALQAQSQSADLVIVDNASGDGSADELERAYPGVRIVRANSNRGYGPGMNVGVAEIRSANAFLLVTHECVLATDAVERMAHRLSEAPNVAIVGPLLGYRDEPERVFSAGGYFLPDGETAHVIGPPAMSDWAGRGPRRAAWLDGACMLVRREAWEAVGGLDEGYFMYFEETELCHRVRRAGWDVECVPAAKAWQRPGAIPLDLWTRNRIRFSWRNRRRREAVRYLVSSLVLGFALVVRDRLARIPNIERREKGCRMVLGVWYVLRGRGPRA